MADSHYISEFLLRNWESYPGKLQYFDFSNGKIKESSAQGMFVSDVPFPDNVEKWLGQTIETPLGRYLARCKRDQTFYPPLPREEKAIILALLAQGARTELAQNPADATLAKLVSMDKQTLNQFVTACQSTTKLVVARASGGYLFFPSLGIVPLPILGAVGWFLPLDPQTFAIIVPGKPLDGALA